MLDERERRSRHAPEIALPPHVSASSLVAMRRDRDAFAVQLRRPVPQEPSAAAQRGSALHAWIEAQFGHVPLLAADDLDFEGEVSPDLAGLQQIFSQSEWAGRQPSDIEVDVEVPIAGVTVRSRIDAVFPPGGGLTRTTVVDWKSGRPPRDDDERAAREVQLAVYRLAWSEWKGIPLADVDAAFYYVSDDLTVRPQRLLSRDDIVALIKGA